MFDKMPTEKITKYFILVYIMLEIMIDYDLSYSNVQVKVFMDWLIEFRCSSAKTVSFFYYFFINIIQFMLNAWRISYTEIKCIPFQSTLICKEIIAITNWLTCFLIEFVRKWYLCNFYFCKFCVSSVRTKLSGY